MADKETGVFIPVSAYADENSAKEASKELVKSVLSSLKDGYIEVPAEIKASYSRGSKELEKAQKDVIAQWEKMSKQGFSSSEEYLDELIEKYQKFKRLAGKEGKSNSKQTKWLSKTIGESLQPYLTQKRELDAIIKSFATMTKESKAVKKSTVKKPKTSDAYDKYLSKQEQYSKQAKGAGERKELFKELEEVRKNKSEINSTTIGPSRTNDHMMRLSEFSAHGSNWANELAKTLKIETARAAKALTTWIEPHYKPKSVGSNSRPTTEKEFLTATMKSVQKELVESIKKSEAGDETITADTIKEYAAIIKVLSRSLGKTTEDAMKNIYNKIEKVYSYTDTIESRRGAKSGLTKLGGTSREAGQEKGVGPGHERTNAIVKDLYNTMKQWRDEVSADKIAKECLLGVEETITTATRRASGKTQASQKVEEIKMSDEFRSEMNNLTNASVETFGEIRRGNKITAAQANIDKIENVREAIADSGEQQNTKLNADINRDVAKAVKKDMATGFNTDTKANELIGLVRNILSAITGKQPEETTPPSVETSDKKEQKSEKTTVDTKAPVHPDYSFEMKAVYAEIEDVLKPIEKASALVPVLNSVTQSKENPFGVSKEEFNKALPKLTEPEIGPQVKKSKIYASQFNQGVFKGLETAFERLIGVSKQYEKVLGANADAQDEMAAKRIQDYGLNNGRNPNDTGDKAGMRRILELYRTNKASIDQNPELLQNIQLTAGRDVDTTELLKELNKALSGKQMEKAQNGGGFWKNAFGFMTGGLGYAFMPSLEKSRAQADGLNQMLGNISNALQSVLINIQTKETELAGLEKKGDIKFDAEGNVVKGTSAAKKTLADLEEEKLVLDSIKADLLANDEIIKKTGGRFSQMVKYLNFTSPVLKDNNGILRNINSGLDKNGKALKFQTRMAEILNYTYQLMSRHIGQMLKNWLSMISPINLMKRAFTDFSSYNTKWQRTMNVIKYNLRDIILPIMDKIAQLLVNMIGFADIILQKIQAAFGSTPISLFDQKNAKEFKDEVEQINGITASFDELHDIGQDEDKSADNLLGDIYTPELSQEWIDLANEIGDLFAGIITGDMGFGEVCSEILRLLGKLLANIGTAIWDWFKTTAIGKWITENWKELLATLVTLFLGWELLKIFGPTLLSMIGKAFSNLGSVLWSGMKGIGSKLLDVLCGTQFGSDMVRGFKGMFNSGGMIGAFKSGGASLGTIFAQALTAVAGVAIAGASYAAGFDMAADDTSYNIGLMEGGGKEEDKKKSTGAYATSMLGGAAGGALVGLAIGGPIGAAIGAGIGAIAGAITTSLAPAFEELEVQAREANNEMQKLEYYEGVVQGASTQVNQFDQLLQLSNEALQSQTDKVYELGEKYGVSKTTLDSLIQSMKDGNYNSELAVGLNGELVGALEQLDWHYTNNKDVTDKLTEAKKKLQKAEMDLAIAEDIAAGNFELAAARIEVAYASNIYTADEATKKMVQIAKEGSAEQAAAILKDLSPDLQTKFQKEYSATDKGLNELTDLYFEYSKDEREYFLQNLTGEVQQEMQERVNAIKQAVENAPWWQRLLDIGNDGKIFGQSYIDVPGYATGTNYVPSDGLAYLHKGEAVIPAKYNEGVGMQGKAYQQSTAATNELLHAISRLENVINQGIDVRGQFVQRGSDLVATVEKANNKLSNNILNNKVYAR